MYENLTEDQIEELMGALENMIAWTARWAESNADFHEVRNAACAALTSAIKTVDAGA
jgi:hypothetical protein